MPKNPYIHPEFTQVTAVRLSRPPGVRLSLKVENGDLAQGSLYRNGNPMLDQTNQPLRSLAIRTLAREQTVTLRVRATQQAQVALGWPMWENPCFASTLISLGNYFPLDVSTDAGTAPVGATRLPWLSPGAPVLPPERELSVRISDTGALSWSSRGLVSTYTLQEAAGTANELYIALLTRQGEGGSIFVPDFVGPLETELRL